jgi:hypothetical protein
VDAGPPFACCVLQCRGRFQYVPQVWLSFSQPFGKAINCFDEFVQFCDLFGRVARLNTLRLAPLGDRMYPAAQ